MKRLLNILVFLCLSSIVFAQEETRTIDSLENVLSTQQGSERIKTMIQMVWAFYDISFDDGIEWGEKAIKLSHEMGDIELEAEASYAIGVQYGYHNDFDLAQIYLKNSFDLFKRSGNEVRAFDAIWNQAYFELLLGNMDTAQKVFQQVLSMAKERNDDLACAQANANLAVVCFQLNDFNGSIEALKSSRHYYETLNDSAALTLTDFNMATLYGDYGKTEEARRLYQTVIPQSEAYGLYDVLLLAYKNYGLLFERDYVNYDSAYYYFEKALEVTTSEGLSRQDRQTIMNSKADVLAELGNVSALQNNVQQAVDYYEEALSLAESNGYHHGQMQAMVGLGRLYAKQGKTSQSLHYLERYADEASRSGITIMEHEVRKALIVDYARLGRFEEMEKEIEALDEQRAACSRENSDLYEQNSLLSDEMQGLLSQYESQANQIETLQSSRNHYRMAFYGLLAIVLFAVILWLLRIILLNNRKRLK